MTKHFWSAAVGFGMLMTSVGCSEMTTPSAPTNSAVRVLDAASGSTASTGASVGSSEVSGPSSGPTTAMMATSAVVTLQPDLTAAPASVTIPAWDDVLFVNNSGRFVTIHSYNCTEFSLLRIPAGYSRWTAYFRPRKTCDYFAWDVNWSRQIFVGQVVVN